jgi:hypothetical protein
VEPHSCDPPTTCDEDSGCETSEVDVHESALKLGSGMGTDILRSECTVGVGETIGALDDLVEAGIMYVANPSI